MGLALLSRWDELAFCSNLFRPLSTSFFHNFRIHLIFTPDEALNVSGVLDIFPLISVPRVAAPSPHFESKLLLMTAITDSGCPARSLDHPPPPAPPDT